MKKVFIFISFLLSVMGCATTEEILISGNVSSSDRANARKEIKAIVDRNKQSEPDYFYSKVTVTGIINSKPIAADGEVFLKSSPLKGKIVIRDLIFRSPLVFVSADDKSIRIYSVLEKSLFITKGNITKPNFYEKSNSYAMLGYIATGKVPVISDVSVTGYSSEKGSTAMVLENSAFKETIYSRSGLPYKIIFINNSSDEKYEIRYDGYTMIKNFGFFKEIGIKTYSNGNSVNFSYSGIKINTPISDSTFHVEIPEDVKSINLR